MFFGQKLQHVAIIMDGNGRWAQLRGRPRTAGHVKGARVAKKIITHASEQGIKNLTLYAFSTENWMRPQDEVSVLMRLLEKYLKRETENLVKQNIRFHTIGEIEKLPHSIQAQIKRAKELTAKCTGLNVTFAISYSSRQEITSAVKTIAMQLKNGLISENDITDTTISNALMTKHCPDPDLIIRTSGESRLSNFLMWQAAYSELYFTDVLWPDFTEADFDVAVKNFLNRERRFGKTSQQIDTITSPTTLTQTSTSKQSYTTTSVTITNSTADTSSIHIKEENIKNEKEFSI